MATRWRLLVRLTAIGILAVLVGPDIAQATDTWTKPFPGVQVLHRTGPKKLNLYAAKIDLCQAGVSVRHTAFAERGQRTSKFAKTVGAQLAINADFSCRPIDVDPKKSPFAPCIGKPKYGTYGIAAHAGTAWPQTIFKDALLAFGQERAEIWDNAQDKEFDAAWMQEVLSGHPSVVLGGKQTIADCPINPRTAVGLSADGNTLYAAVVDGRNGWRGMTCKEAGALLVELGADRGFILDGGGSSTFWQQGIGVRNHPSDGVERVVGPHLAVFAKGGGAAPHCEPPSVLHPKAPLPAYKPIGAPAWLQSIGPVRVFDTRTAAGAKPLSGLKKDSAGRMAAGSTASWKDTKWMPAGTAAVVLNLTTVSATASGFLTAWSGTGAMPDVSHLVYGGGAAAGNAGPIAIGKAGVSLYSYRATHLIGDLQARFGAKGAGFVASAPYRALDTRKGNKPLTNGKVRELIKAPSGTEAMVLGVTVVEPVAGGFVTVFPCGGAVPNSSNVNFAKGENRAALAVVAPSNKGICAASNVQAHLLVDVYGRFDASNGAQWQAVAPVRVIDTRKTTGRWTGKVRPGKSLPLKFSDMPGFPSNVVGVTFNVTAVRPRGAGFVAFGPCGTAPKTSTLNFRENHNVAVGAWMGLGADATLCLTASARTHVLIDVNGVFVAPPAPPKDPPDAGSTADAGAPDAGPIDAAPESGDTATPDATAAAPDTGQIDVVTASGDSADVASAGHDVASVEVKTGDGGRRDAEQTAQEDVASHATDFELDGVNPPQASSDAVGAVVNNPGAASGCTARPVAPLHSGAWWAVFVALALLFRRPEAERQVPTPTHSTH